MQKLGFYQLLLPIYKGRVLRQVFQKEARSLQEKVEGRQGGFL